MLRSARSKRALIRTIITRKHHCSSILMSQEKDDIVRGFESICLHGGYTPDETTSRGVPLYRTTPYQFRSAEHAANLFSLKKLGFIYSRLGNPTNEILEKRFAMLCGAPPMGALAVASGTSASFFAVVNLAEQGDNIVSSRNLYGGTFTQLNDILPKFGITTKFVDITNLEEVEAAIDEKTRAIFCETVSNPALEISPLEELAKLGDKVGLPLIVDDTFTTPYLMKPFEWGASIVTHSLTKWAGGHGTAIGGIVVDSGKFNWGAGKHPLFTEPDTSYGGLRWGLDLPEEVAPLAFIQRMRNVPLRNLGACMSPDNAWIVLQGIETLPLRMDRHCDNALAVAKMLKNHPAVEWVRFPGLGDSKEYEKNLKYLKGKGGSMVVVELKGGKDKGQNFIERLKMFSHVANVGDCKSLAIHPATTTHSQLSEEQQRLCGITPGLIRLSIGIESTTDILDDLNQALKD